MNRLNRRRFLKRSAGVAALMPWLGAGLAPASLRAAGVNDRIRVGLIGCGGMGNGDMNSLMHQPDTQIVAVCDPDRSRSLASRASVETYYADQSRSGSFTGCDDYDDYRDLLARDDIDAVIQATPDHWHALQMIDAVKAGAHVYVQKPISVDVMEGEAMVAAARKYNRVVQVGTQRRSDGRYKGAARFVQSGDFGKVIAVEMHSNVNQSKRWRRQDEVKALAEDAASGRFDVKDAWKRYRLDRPEDDFDPRKYLKAATLAMKGICKERYEAFGTAGNASKIKVINLEEMFNRYASGELDPRVN